MNVLDIAQRIGSLCDRLTEIAQEQEMVIASLRFNAQCLRDNQKPVVVAIDCHTQHCCQEHKRCKYGQEDTCSVCTGQKPASFTCNCEWM